MNKISLYKAFCPMAFSGKGGGWIQSDKTIANPYSGSKILRCGSVKSQLAGEKAMSGHNLKELHYFKTRLEDTNYGT